MAFTNSQGRTQSSLSDINITPFVDVVLVLLIIFMLTAPIIQSGIEVNVPSTQETKQTKEDLPIISIDKTGVYTLNGKPVNIHEITGVIHQKFTKAKAVYVRASRRLVRRKYEISSAVRMMQFRWEQGIVERQGERPI